MPDAKVDREWGAPWPLPDPRLLRPKRSARGWIIASIVFSVFVAGLGACEYVGDRPGNLGGPIWSTAPKPIPVARRSCPYLREVHDTALQAGVASGDASNANEPRYWHLYVEALAAKLIAFDVALRTAALRTPSPIAADLRFVHSQVVVGFRALSGARTGAAWSQTTFDAVANGYLSLDDASDLTGNACGFTLAPDTSVFLNHVG